MRRTRVVTLAAACTLGLAGLAAAPAMAAPQIIWSDHSSTSTESMVSAVDYDSAAKTVGLTCTGQGHEVLSLYNNTVVPAAYIASIDCDQFSDDGQRHIVAGPGATGVDTAGQALPTSPVPQSIVAAVTPSKTRPVSMIISATWQPA